MLRIASSATKPRDEVAISMTKSAVLFGHVTMSSLVEKSVEILTLVKLAILEREAVRKLVGRHWSSK